MNQMTYLPTDLSIPAIRAYIEKELARKGTHMVRLTQGQILALLARIDELEAK
jgi:hypothetical protein